MSKWINVQDELPKDYTDVLVAFTNTTPHSGGRYVDAAYYSDEKGWRWTDDVDVNTQVIEITHWRPMPRLPEEEEE